MAAAGFLNIAVSVESSSLGPSKSKLKTNFEDFCGQPAGWVRENPPKLVFSTPTIYVQSYKDEDFTKF
jgi:hypothetical protein